MTYFRTLLFFASAACLLGQTPPPKPPAPPPMPEVRLSTDEAASKPPDVPPDRVVIAVGDVKITAAQFDHLVDSLQPQYRTAARGAGRRQFADNVVQMLTLAQEGQRRKLDESSDYKIRSMFQNANLMASIMVEQLGKDVQVSDAELRLYYDGHKTEFDQVKARHILIRFQGSQVPVRAGQKDLSDAEALAKALEIRKKIEDGLDFAEIARLESDDVSSGSKGGDLPPFKHGQMVPSFEEAAFALKPGELSQPVKSQFGYHLIQVSSHSGFDDVKADVEKVVKPQQTQKAVTKEIEDLQKSSPPVLDSEFFGPDKSPAKK
jgi:peptidyl-prolyl cis-trans isomerase C